MHQIATPYFAVWRLERGSCTWGADWYDGTAADVVICAVHVSGAALATLDVCALLLCRSQQHDWRAAIACASLLRHWARHGNGLYWRRRSGLDHFKVLARRLLRLTTHNNQSRKKHTLLLNGLHQGLILPSLPAAALLDKSTQYAD